VNAYNFFFKEERQKIIAERISQQKASSATDTRTERQPKPSKKRKASHGIVGFSELGKIVGERWKKLSDDQKEKYFALAAQDKERYRVEQKNYKNSMKIQDIENLRNNSDQIKDDCDSANVDVSSTFENESMQPPHQSNLLGTNPSIDIFNFTSASSRSSTLTSQQSSNYLNALAMYNHIQNNELSPNLSIIGLPDVRISNDFRYLNATQFSVPVFPPLGQIFITVSPNTGVRIPQRIAPMNISLQVLENQNRQIEVINMPTTSPAIPLQNVLTFMENQNSDTQSLSESNLNNC